MRSQSSRVSQLIHELSLSSSAWLIESHWSSCRLPGKTNNRHLAMSMKNNLKKIRYWAVLVAGFAGLVVSGLLYSPLLFGNAYMLLRGIDPRSMANMKFPAWEMLGELAHVFLIAFVVAYFFAALCCALW